MDQPSQHTILSQSFLTQFKRTDGPWSWIMCMLLVLSVMFQYGCACIYGIMFPNILKEFQSGRAVTAMPGSLGIATTGVFCAITGWMSDIIGSNRLMVLGSLISAIGILSSSFVPSIQLLILTYGVILGFGASCVYISAMTGIHLYFQKNKFEATSVVNVGPSSALLIMSPIAEKLNDSLGWRKSMLCMTGFSIVPFVIGFLMRPNVSEPENSRRTNSNPSQTTRQLCNVDVIYCSAFRIKIYLLTTIMSSIASVGHSMPFVHLAKFCDDIGMPSNLSSWLYFTIGISSTVSRVLVGKFGKSTPLSLPQIFQVGCLLLILGNFYLPSVSRYYALVLYAIGYGFGEGLLAGAFVNIIIDCLPPERRGSGYGIFQFFLSSAYVVGPIISGLIADATGSYNYAFYVAASLEIAGGSIAVLTWFNRSSRQEVETEQIFIERETVL